MGRGSDSDTDTDSRNSDQRSGGSGGSGVGPIVWRRSRGLMGGVGLEDQSVYSVALEWGWRVNVCDR